MDIEPFLPAVAEINKVLSRQPGAIPSVPAVAIKLFQLVRNENTGVPTLAKLIETDTGLSTAVLKRVNSAAYGLGRKISSIQDAVVILGFQTIREMSLEILVYKQILNQTYGSFDILSFWRHSLAVAYLSRELAKVVDAEIADASYCAGLLHDIGKIILEVAGKISYSEFLHVLSEKRLDLPETEERILGLAHDAIGAYYCHHWGFPDSISLVVGYHHRGFAKLNPSDQDTRLLAIVSLSDFISHMQGLALYPAPIHNILLPEATEILDLENIDIEPVLRTTDEYLAETAKFFRFQFPDMPTLRSNLLRENLHLARMNEHHRKQDSNLSDAWHDKLRNSLVIPHHSLDADEIKRATLQAIRSDLGFDRLYLFDVHPTDRCLVLSYVLDRSSLPGIPEGTVFPISLDSEKILTCLRRGIPVAIAGETLVELEFLKPFNISSMGLIPIFRKGRVTGCIGVDNGIGHRQIPPDSLVAMKGIAGELGVALENAQSFEMVQQKANLDPLTGIFNRGATEEFLARLIGQASTDKATLAVAMVDIDHFKRFNDDFGHRAGDDILKVVASALRKYSRPQDRVGRYGGEEFLIVLDKANFRQALLFGERIRARIESLGRVLEKRFKNHWLTISAGIAEYDPMHQHSGVLIESADQALYAAKHGGRNRVMGFHDGKIVSLGG